MATAPVDINSLENMFECAVCLEHYTDPRNLMCGHNFCRSCLEDVLEKQATRVIPCPLCRLDTELSPGKTAFDLPKSVLITQIQEKVKGVRSTCIITGPGDIRACDLCTHQNASHYCRECNQNFCKHCTPKHSEFEGQDGHAAISIDLLCEFHPKLKVARFCKTCNICICSVCAMGEHHQHNKEKLETAAKKSESRLLTFLSENQDCLHYENALQSSINSTLEELENAQQTLKDSAPTIRRLFREIENKFNRMEKDTEKRLSAEIDKLTAAERAADRVVVNRSSIVDRALYLVTEALQPELIVQERKLLASGDMENIAVHCLETVWIPNVHEITSNIVRNLNETIDGLTCQWSVTVLCSSKPMTTLIKKHNFTTAATIAGLVVDVQRQKVIVRTRDPRELLQIYTLDGKLKKKMAVDVDVVTGVNGGLDIDTKRDLYLLPCRNNLKLLDTRGLARCTFKVGKYLYGVAYGSDNDVYVVSDVENHKVFVINAHTRQLITQFGSQGTEKPQFNWPYNICVGRISGIEETVIIVSDCFNHRIKVFKLSGQHLKTFGSHGNGQAQLMCPWGVAIDSAGRIIVCDRDNNRVVSFWNENKQDKWHCILDTSKGPPAEAYSEIPPVDYAGWSPWWKLLFTSSPTATGPYTVGRPPRPSSIGKPFNVAVNPVHRTVLVDMENEVQSFVSP